MAFLDNSGDIVLDAVLTKEGREKLARGRPLEIKTFALGDDEINYSSYNIAHPSGSAYYDLEVLQTPVLESITGRPAGINHGLLKMTSIDDLLYLPIVKLNTKELRTTLPGDMSTFDVRAPWRPYRGVFYMVCNVDTYDALVAAKIASDLPSEIGDNFERSFWSAFAPTTNMNAVVFESGLDTNDVPKDLTTRENLLSANGLLGSQYFVDADQRLFNRMWSPEVAPDGRGRVSFDQKTDTGEFIFGAKMSTTPLGSTLYGMSEVFNYTRTDIAARPRPLIFRTDSGVTPLVSTYSELAGPTGDVTCFVPLANTSRLGSSVVDSLWTDLGKKVAGNVLIEGATGTLGSTQFHFIDTIVYVNHGPTNASTQFTIRLIRTA